MLVTTEVIICTYNGSEYIIEQLDSILNQTKAVNKISIYDDKSSDDTLIKIYDFINKLSYNQQNIFSVHINPENLGYACNFMSAIEKSTEEILFLCDQDDIWGSEKVNVFVNLFTEYHCDMVFSDGFIVDQFYNKSIGIRNKSVLQSYGLSNKHISVFYENSFFFLTKKNYINGASSAVRRSAAQSALPLPCDMPHDYWLGIWCSLHNGVVASPKKLWSYRQHQHNTIGMGSSHPYYFFWGIWKNPNAPRKRELRIWKAVTGRISKIPRKNEVQFAQQKLRWLSVIIDSESSTKTHLFFEIFKSIINGSYLKFSPNDSLFRDIIYLFKKK